MRIIFRCLVYRINIYIDTSNKALKSPYDRNTRVPSDNDKKGLQVQLQQLAEA